MLLLGLFTLPTLSLILPGLLALYVFSTYLRNPLRRIPAAHPLAPFTSLWILGVRYRRIENATLRDAHQRLGPVICLSPNEVSVNCVKGGIKDVYAGGFEKAGLDGYGWYQYFGNYGVPNMFSTGGNKSHSARKRMLSNIYSKSVLISSPALLAQVSSIIYHRLLPALSSTFSESESAVLNIYALLSASTMDIVTGYIFGLASGSKLVCNPQQLSWFLDLYNSRRSFDFWPQELPGFTAMLHKWTGFKLVPHWVGDANKEIEKWTKGMCEGAARVLGQGEYKVEDTPVVYQQLAAALSNEAKRTGDEETDLTEHIASELLDHLAAGFDTSGITLTYVIHELSKHVDIQSRLQAELLTLSPSLTLGSAPDLPNPKIIDSLPLLHAVIWESLRLHSAIPGPQPRFAPASGCHLGPDEKSYYVPGGVRVSASAGLLHLNEEVYEQASEWRPDRWLVHMDEEKRMDMESRWFWAFGSGGRMCVGSHLAVYLLGDPKMITLGAWGILGRPPIAHLSGSLEASTTHKLTEMKYIIAAIYSNYTTTIVDDTNIEQIDAYTAPPKSGKLLIKLSKPKHVKAG